MNTNLFITVNGHAGTGKSTITKIIKDALEEMGFEVNVENEDSYIIDFSMHQEERIKSIKEKFPKLTIKQNQLKTSSNKKTNCKYPDWEGGLTSGEHILDKDGYCNICGEKEILTEKL